MIRRIAFAALIAAAATPLGAQINRGRGQISTGPGYWVGLSYGYMDGMTLNDGRSNATWAFSYSSQLRATIEKAITGGFTLGAAAGFSNPKLSYVGRSVGACSTDATTCQAQADVTQYTVFVRNDPGPGFHGLFSLEAGGTQFSKFRNRDTGTAISSSSSFDFTFGFGGGFGYGVSQNTELYISEQMDVVMHPQADGSTGVPKVSVFRAGARIGF